MPTILDTLGIASTTISYGKEGSFAGKLATVSIRVTPKAIGIDNLRLTWAATGDMFSGFIDSTTGTSGTPGVIVLPQTGQTGFRHGTTTFKDWYYEAVVTAVLDDGQQLSRVYRFQIPAGTTTLDLDLLDEDGVVTILPAIAPILAEPAGLSNDTRTALAATYVALRGAWASGTTYPRNSLVIQSGAVYLAPADVPARTTFTATDWQSLGSATSTPTTSGLAISDLGNGLASVALVGAATFTDLGNGLAAATGATVTDSGNGLATVTDITSGGGSSSPSVALDTDGVPYYAA